MAKKEDDPSKWSPATDAWTPGLVDDNPFEQWRDDEGDQLTEAKRLRNLHSENPPPGHDDAEEPLEIEKKSGALTTLLSLYRKTRTAGMKRRRRPKRHDSVLSEVDMSDHDSHSSAGSATSVASGFSVMSTASKLSRFGRRLARKRRHQVTVHVRDILERQRYILKLARALLVFGSPGHRIVTQLTIACKALALPADFFTFPGLVFVSFGDVDSRTSECHAVKSAGKLDLGKLPKCVTIFKQVVHDDIDVVDATDRLSSLLKEPPHYGRWWTMLFASLKSGIMCVMGFKGSVVDAAMVMILGAFANYMSTRGGIASGMYASIFEVSMITMFSFVARGLSSTGYFCYESLTAGAIVNFLPGLAFLLGSIDLASKNLVSGAVRMVHAFIFTLFLGFGTVIGSDLYNLVDPKAASSFEEGIESSVNMTTLTGLFTSADGVLLNGTFSFSSSSSSTSTIPLHSLEHGKIACRRMPEWAWWRNAALVTPYMLIGLVPVYSTVVSSLNQQPLRDWQMFVQVTISSLGYLTNFWANRLIFNGTDVVSFVGAFTVATLGNIYARFAHRPAFTVMATGVMFLTPGGLAAAGGLAMSYTSHQSSLAYSASGITLALRMVQTAIGTTCGLFVSSFVVNWLGIRGTGAFTF